MSKRIWWKKYTVGRSNLTMFLDRLKIGNYITDERTKHNAFMSIMDGVAFSIMAGLTQPFWGAFAVKLGATDYMLALLSSLPALVTLSSQIPAAILIDKYDNRLKPTLLAATMTRLSYLIFALLAVIPGNPLTKAWVFIIVFALRNFPGTMCDTAWTSMMGEMFPPKLRGRVFSERNMLITMVSLLATVVAGPFLDIMPWPYNYGVLYSISFAAVMVSVYYLTRLREAPVSNQKKKESGSRLQAFRLVLKDRVFATYLKAMILLNIGFHIPASLWTILWVRRMGLSNAWLGAFTISSGIASFASYTFWGRLSEKHGNMKILALGSTGHMLFPLLYGRLQYPIVHLLVHAFNGFVGAGHNLGAFNALLDISPAETRPNYIAAYNIVQGLSAFVWPFLGVWIYRHIGLSPTLDIVFLIRLVTMSITGYLFFNKLSHLAKEKMDVAA